MNEIIFSNFIDVAKIIVAELIVAALGLGAQVLFKRYKAKWSPEAVQKRIGFYESFSHTDEMETLSKTVSMFVYAIFAFAGAAFVWVGMGLWFSVALAEATVASTIAGLGHPLPPAHYPQRWANVLGAISGLLVAVSLSFLMSVASEALKLSKTHRCKEIDRFKKMLPKLPEGEPPPRSSSATAS